MKSTSNTFIRLALSSLMMACLCLSMACQNTAVDRFDLAAAKTEIENANKNFAELVSNGDAEGIANECYTADAKFFMANGPVVEGRKNIQSAFETMLKANKGGKVDPATTIAVWGDEQTLTEEGTYRIYKADGSIFEQGKYLILWKKEDGKWKIYRDCSNSDLPITAAK